MSHEEKVFIFVLIFMILTICCIACCEVYCKGDKEELAAGNPQNQSLSGQYNVVTTRPTSNTQINNNYNHIGFTFNQAQPNQSNPSVTTRSPQVPSAPQPARNLTDQFDSPPSYDEATKNLQQEQNQ